MEKVKPKRKDQFERFMLRIIQHEGADKGHTRSIKLLLLVLNGFSKLFTGITMLRAWLFNAGMLKRFPLGCQVISVGNVTVGGTGKTPVVEILAKTLTADGRKVAILSRGYRKKEQTFWEKLRHGTKVSPPRVVSNGKKVLLNSELSGDEPFMLASNLPGVVVLVDKDRVKSGRYAIKEFNCDVLILDDGFQYMKLKHSHEIVLVDHTNPFGNGHLLPRGILREPAKNIKRADLIFITKSNGKTRTLRGKIREMNRKAEIVECRHRPCYFKDLNSEKILKLEDIAGMRVVVLSGIASPMPFEASIRKLDGNVLSCERFSDHYRFRSKDIEGVIAKAKELNAEAILTTEKDAVRFPEVDNTGMPIYYMRMDIEILDGMENFTHFVNKICFK